MAREDLIEWVKEHKDEGHSRQTLKEVLLEHGWKEHLIEEALEDVFQQGKKLDFSLSTSQLRILSAVLAVLLLGGAGFLFYQGQEQPADQWMEEPQREKAASFNTTCGGLIQNLRRCKPMMCKFQHKTGEVLKKEVYNLSGGECQYVEEMPKEGKMQCVLTPDMRRAVAEYFSNVENSASSSFRVAISEEEKNISYLVDGEEMKNPLEHALKTGQCTVTGYAKNLTLPNSSNTSQ